MSVKWKYPMPRWLDKAFRYRGLKEIPGKRHNPIITKWLISLRAWWKDDETPWCGTFVAHCLRSAGLPVPKHWYRAKAYAVYGYSRDLDAIPFGAVCVKSRRGGGHVFFAVAQSECGKIIYGLGGNQRNEVNIMAFKRSVITNARWPAASSVKEHPLPIVSDEDAKEFGGVGGSEG